MPSITDRSLANYATRAVAQIRQDTQATYHFVEWVGEKDLILSPPQTAAKWARATIH